MLFQGGAGIPAQDARIATGRAVGRGLSRTLAGLLATGAILVFGIGSAQAASGGATLQVAVAGTESAPQLVLTNDSSAPCQAPDTSLGTVVLDQVEQNGKQVQPVTGQAWFDDSIPHYLATRLHTLAPGQTLRVPLPLVSTNATGPALESAAWSESGPSADSLYPVKASEPIRIELTYAPALVAPGSAPLCSPSATTSSATLGASGPISSSASGSGSASSSRSGLFGGLSRVTLFGGAAGIVIVLVVLLLVFLRVRKRRAAASTATKAAVVLALFAAALVHTAVAAPPASAAISVAGNLSQAYSQCSAIFKGIGGDPAGILPTLNGPTTVEIMYTGNDQNHEDQLPDGKVVIFWNPNDNHAYAGNGGGSADPCSTLYHEMYHAYQDLDGEGQNHGDCWTAGPNGALVDSGIPTNEVEATRAQNLLRATLGLPPRETYGELALPDGTCENAPAGPPDPDCSGVGCGDTNGDPHLTTFEGVRYDFQGAGEFVAADDPRGGYQIQVREQSFLGSQSIAVNTAVALDVAGDRVQVTMGTQGLLLTVNGVAQSTTTPTLPHGGTITSGFASTGQTLTATWPDTSTATITQIGPWGLRLNTKPAAVHAGHLKGLLGNLGGNPADSVQTSAGGTIATPSFSTLYPGFANSWRVTGATSLFTYAPGTSTATYTDLSFPHAPATLSQVPDLAQATSQCTAAGITDPTTLKDCELDVGLTGQSDFAGAAAAGQPAPATEPSQPTTNAGVFGIDGAPATVDIDKPGGSAALHFTGSAGETVFVDVTAATLPDQCGDVQLNAPNGTELGEGCIVSGNGDIEATKLPSNGQYTVLLDPKSAATGSATVQLFEDVDQTGTITPGGPPVTATIGQPGATARFTFSATPGMVVFLDSPSSTLPEGCSVLAFQGPNGSDIAGGCVISGAGYVAATTIKASGTYAVVVDPGGTGTGDAVLRLLVEHDQTTAISVDGPPVTAVIAQPGEQSRLTFQGTAGQSVAFRISGSTLPDGCGDFELDSPSGADVINGCIIDGAATVPATKLPSTGQYTILFEPGGVATGSAIVRLTSG
jgi:von Willebrand factor type D domain/Effector protein